MEFSPMTESTHYDGTGTGTAVIASLSQFEVQPEVLFFGKE